MPDFGLLISIRNILYRSIPPSSSQNNVEFATQNQVFFTISSLELKRTTSNTFSFCEINVIIRFWTEDEGFENGEKIT